MAGTDQSANLGGMLSNIDWSIDPTMFNAGIVNTFRPELDMSDPTSMENYMNWGLKTGELTEGQATQMGWQVAKLREKMDADNQAAASQGLVRGYRGTQAQLGQLQENLAQAERAGNPAAIDKLKTLIAGTESALDNQLSAIKADPTAYDAIWQEDTRDFTIRQRIATEEAAAAAAEADAEQAQFDQLTNTFTGMIISGQLDPNSDQGKQTLAMVAQQYPAAMENIVERVGSYQTKLTKMENTKGDMGTALIPKEQFDVFDNPEQSYDAYKKQHTVNPRAANERVTKEWGNLIGAKAARGEDDYVGQVRWTDTKIRKAGKLAVAGLVNLEAPLLAELREAEETMDSLDRIGPINKEGYPEAKARVEAIKKQLTELARYSTKAKNGYLTDDAKALRSGVEQQVINYLQANEMEPTTENVNAAVMAVMSGEVRGSVAKQDEAGAEETPKAGSQQSPVSVSSKGERDKLAPGTYYKGPDGKVRVKS